MKLRHRKLFTTATAVVLVLLSSVYPSFAGEGGAGTTIYKNHVDLGNGVTYTNTISQNSTYGIQESHAFSTVPGNIVKPIVLACDTIYGSMNINSVVGYAQRLGYNVLAAVNSDFFSMSTGVPLGIVIENGIYKCSPEGYPSVLFDADGRASVVENTAVQIKMTNQGGGDAGAENAGKYVMLTHFNKMRQNGAGLYLFDEHFSTVSTRTSSAGWAVKFKILDGEMKTKGTMQLQVAEVYEGSSPMTIGSGYMVLTADDKSNRYYEFEKFSVGDMVTLETSCYNNTALENAKWATGAGNIIVQNGAITDSSAWDSALLYKNPRSALGIKADGTVVYYELDGRQPGHSNGISMKQLAQEFIDQGCVTAVNFDGGGSSAIAAKLPGSASVQVLSTPSDGALRKCSTYILLVSEAVSNGIPNRLTLDQAGSVVYQGASMNLSYKAIDSGYQTTAAPSDVSAQVTAGYGEIEDQVYTAGWVAGMETISMSSPSSGVTGQSSVYVTNTLSDISVKADGKPVSSLSLNEGDQVQFSQTATYNGKNVIIGQNNFKYTLTGDDVASISDTGLLTIKEEASGSAVLSIASGGVVKTVNISVKGVFSDISGHWAESYITQMYEKGVVNGMGGGMFKPGSNIKRADFMLMLYRASGSPEVTGAENLSAMTKENGLSASDVDGLSAAASSGSPETDAKDVQGRRQEGSLSSENSGGNSGFADVADDAYYADAVKWAKGLGIAQGDGTNFNPSANMTREDAFTFLHRYLKEKNVSLTQSSEDTLAVFTDADQISSYAREAAAQFVASKIVDGYDGRINPKGLLTRAEMCKILSIALEMI